ncbi:MAG: DUF512 domain-containing protein [Clostridia bacterium]
MYNGVMAKITCIKDGTIAEEIGLSVGDEILKINGKAPRDILDFVFADSLTRVKLLTRNSLGEKIVYSISKYDYEPLGFEVDDSMQIVPTECCNNCVFCFINQLPKGMRDSLYVKDDDWRLSFASGNYVTLTNLTRDDYKRIIKQKISPLYVSVHASDDKRRNAMLGNTTTKMNIVKSLKKLFKAGIVIDAQIVLCPRFNDGDVLRKTLVDIEPFVSSIAVVPVGLSGHREGLPKLFPVTKVDAIKTIEIIDEFNDSILLKRACTLAYASDEFYLLANHPLPTDAYYGSYAQIENGVGLLTKFDTEFKTALSSLTKAKAKPKNLEVTIATGFSAYEFISAHAKIVADTFGVKVNVFKIENKHFGSSITVTGLLTGKDIISQLKNKVRGNLILARCMFRENTDIFLDDSSASDVENQLNCKVVISDNDGESFIRTILG